VAEPIDVVLICDAGFFIGLQTTVASIALHEKLLPLRIHLLDGGVLDSQWNSLVATVLRLNPRAEMIRHRVDMSGLTGLDLKKEWPYLVYARLLLPNYIQSPCAVYVDADFLVTRPLSPLLDLLGSDRAVYAAHEVNNKRLKADCPWADEMGIDISSYAYYNAGLMLLNLDKWRREKIADQLLAFLRVESKRCPYLEQTAINWLLRDDIETLPKTWNAPVSEYDLGIVAAKPGEINLHFGTGMKPWRRRQPWMSHDLWWLFSLTFLPASALPHPFRREPKNLARYLLTAFRERKRLIEGRQQRRQILDDWKIFWSQFPEAIGHS
jgi:lipopolysaccharide biosynthesis glycosyltransferase